MNPAVGFLVDKVFPGLIGTGVGAWLAFWSKGRMDARDEIKKQKASANYAMFVLQRHINELVCLEKELNLWRSEPYQDQRWLYMMPLHQFTELPDLRIEELSWMIQRLEPNLLSKFLVARDKVLSVRGVLALRREVKNRVNDHLEAVTSHITFPGGITHETLVSFLSSRQVTELQMSSNHIFEFCTDAFHYNYDFAIELHAAFRALWPSPKVRIIQLEPKIDLLSRENLELPCPSSTPSTASTKA